jgi:hypothetical protein
MGTVMTTELHASRTRSASGCAQASYRLNKPPRCGFSSSSHTVTVYFSA